jgi:integrase
MQHMPVYSVQVNEGTILSLSIEDSLASRDFWQNGGFVDLGPEYVMDLGPDCDNVPPAIDSTAKGETVARRRHQNGSVYKNKNKRLWKLSYVKYGTDSTGGERRFHKEETLGLTKTMTKRQAFRAAHLRMNEINESNLNPTQIQSNTAFSAFTETWESDYLCTCRPSTQATMKGHAKKLTAAFGQKPVRQITAADIQRFVSSLQADELEPKTIRNHWITLRLILGAARTQGYADQIPEKPKLPRATRKRARWYPLEETAAIIVNAEGSLSAFWWLAAEAGLRIGELCGLSIHDVQPDRIAVNRSVWNGRTGPPKTPNSIRSIATSTQLQRLLRDQVAMQKAKGHTQLFSTETGGPWDANNVRNRELLPRLRRLGFPRAGFHAFRHFNTAQLLRLGVSLKTIVERHGRDAGSLTIDVYGHSTWEQNAEAAQLLGDAIEKAVNSCRLTAVQQIGLPTAKPEALCDSE